MIIDNSFRLFTTQSRLVWKVLLYQIIYIVVLAGIAIACCYSLIDAFISKGLLQSTTDVLLNNVFNPKVDDILVDINEMFDKFWSIITMSTENTISAILFVFIVFVLGNFVFSLMQIPLTEVIYGYMGSSSRLSFVGCYLSNFGRSVKYALCRTITSLPVDFAIFAAFVGLLKLLAIGGVMTFFAPFIIVLVLLLLLSFRMTIFGLWTPAMVAMNRGTWKAFATSIKLGFKNFKTVFPTHILVVLIALAVNFGLAIFTCGVGCIIAIPATVVFSSIISLVLYFHFCGLRYYIDKARIISPKKIDDQEHISDVKFII